VARVIIGVDPHKRSSTIEVINEREQTVGQGRFGTDRDGHKARLAAGRQHKDRVWAVEGCSGIGRQIQVPCGRAGRDRTQRLIGARAGRVRPHEHRRRKTPA
jgi:hypothetical protein